jgi:hypothetical protein
MSYFSHVTAGAHLQPVIFTYLSLLLLLFSQFFLIFLSTILVFLCCYAICTHLRCSQIFSAHSGDEIFPFSLACFISPINIILLLPTGNLLDSLSPVQFSRLMPIVYCQLCIKRGRDEKERSRAFRTFAPFFPLDEEKSTISKRAI